jgi:SAM-dependent methyltransferase
MRNDTVWQTAALTRTYLEGVRGAIPLAQEQIAIMLRLIRAACPVVRTVLDLGCGNGILGQAVLDQQPEAHGIFLDFSAPMLAAARQKLAGYEGRVTFVQADYGQKGWEKAIPGSDDSIVNRFDVIISGFSIHHQPDERKREVYAEVYHLLKPEGIFLNLEHVASRTTWGEKRFEEHFLDSLFAYHQAGGAPKTRQQINEEFYSRPDKAANILTLVETQCDWLREIGFEHVDCFLKVFELALFGGLKPREK